MNGAIHKIADMGSFSFVTIRNREGLVQCVWDSEEHKDTVGLERSGMAVESVWHGDCRLTEPVGLKSRLSSVEILSEHCKTSYIGQFNKWKGNTSLETKTST